MKGTRDAMMQWMIWDDNVGYDIDDDGKDRSKAKAIQEDVGWTKELCSTFNCD